MLNYFTQSVVAEKQPFNKEYRIIRRNDGKERWAWGRGELIFNTDGSPAVGHTKPHHIETGIKSVDPSAVISG